MPPSSAAGGEAPRQCWECLRRRWVCDAARPVCNKCRAAGIVCPGYNDRKPLTWLAPGRVTSRARRQNPCAGQRASTGSGAGSGSASASAKGKKAAAPQIGPEPLPVSESKQPSSSASSVDAAGSSSMMPALEPAMSRALTTSGSIPRPLSSHTPLGADSPDLAEAAQYYNSYIYPGLVSNQLAPNPFVIPVVSLNSIPTSLRHALVSMTLSHRILQQSVNQASASSPTSPPGSSASSPSSPPALTGNIGASSASGPVDHNSPTSESSALASIINPPPVNAVGPLADMWMRLHQHTGLAIRALNEEIGKESTRSSDATIISVSAFLTAELQQSVSPLWRPHADGLMALITLRGGLGKLINSASHLKPSLLTFVIISVMANTTSPPIDQMTATSHINTADVISELYTIGVYPSLPCPLPLFTIIISINYMRYQLATDPSGLVTGATQISPATILEQINAFVPETWAPSHGTNYLTEWCLIARIFQSAVSVYCTATLPCPPVFMAEQGLHDGSPTSVPIDHRARLFTLLPEAMESSVAKKGMVWPLVVAGVEAASGTAEERAFVDQQLFQMTCDTGASYPLVAKGVLEKFWVSGKTRWDDCFDRPYAVLT